MSEAPDLLNRSTAQKRLEYKYRCAQALIFGLPVVGLHWFGRSLGGVPAESERWTAVLQALLAGWVTYVAASGMLAEGAMRLMLHRRAGADMLVASLALALYLFSFVSIVGVFVRGVPLYGPLLFHYVVILLAAWCGYRWWRLACGGSNSGLQL